MTINNDYHVAWCPFCNQGWVDIIKDSLTNKLFLLCQECDSLWGSPVDVKFDRPVVGRVEIKINEPLPEEIKAIGWNNFLISLNDF